MNINYLVVHCAATGPNSKATAEHVRHWHVEGNGWSDIGYHYVIERTGELVKGRPDNVQGAHAPPVNGESLGICLMGGVDEKGKPDDNFTMPQKVTLLKLLLKLQRQHPIAKIIGHRDVPGTRKACPSFDVAAFLNI